MTTAIVSQESCDHWRTRLSIFIFSKTHTCIIIIWDRGVSINDEEMMWDFSEQEQENGRLCGILCTCIFMYKTKHGKIYRAFWNILSSSYVSHILHNLMLFTLHVRFARHLYALFAYSRLYTIYLHAFICLLRILSINHAYDTQNIMSTR
jgi:hypothetical protein